MENRIESIQDIKDEKTAKERAERLLGRGPESRDEAERIAREVSLLRKYDKLRGGESFLG